ncbi:CLIP1 [Ecytonucleospora hepatopenaei]|uniref:CLIP1 n=1 Tax=Ecytonucleospora hepatopenaei TaxID=646526 RepID=A0A1W0E7C9_9MICR|nr:CLIP1 [Ecytonucleospora hepatopenaei]
MVDDANISYVNNFKLDGSLVNEENNKDLKIGENVTINGRFSGVVKFIGKIDGKDGIWVGLELEKPVGKNNGSYKNKKYFDCKENHGVFIRYDKIKQQQNEEKENSSFMTTEEIINKYTNYLNYTDDKTVSFVSENKNTNNNNFFNNENNTNTNNITNLNNIKNIKQINNENRSFMKNTENLENNKHFNGSQNKTSLFSDYTIQNNNRYNAQNTDLKVTNKSNGNAKRNRNEHNEIVNLLNDIFDAYKYDDTCKMDRNIEIFREKMKKYGIEIDL